MLNKPLIIEMTAAQAPVFKSLVEQVIAALPTSDAATLAQLVVTEWYKRNAGKFVLVHEKLRLTFTPSQAYAINALMKSQPLADDTERAFAQGLIAIIDPKV